MGCASPLLDHSTIVRRRIRLLTEGPAGVRGTSVADSLTRDGLDRLHDALAGHVARHDMPGLVALVARGADVHVEAIGHKDFGDTAPIGRDAIFRIASITKPIVGV